MKVLNGKIDPDRYTLTLPAGRTNDLVVAGMFEALKEMKGSRWADIIIRKNGEEIRFQADWLRYVKVRRQPRIMALLDTIPRAVHLWRLGRRRHDAEPTPETAEAASPPTPTQ